MTPYSPRALEGRWCAIALATTLVAPAAAAQTLELARPVGDTLRFAHTLRVDGVSRGRAGTVAVAFAHDARVAVAFVTADSARAWYDALNVTARGARGTRTDDMRAVLRVPFMLRVRADGAVRTLRAPAMPPLMREVAEFIPQFDDFFPRLPPGRVVLGASRTDTLLDRESSVPGRSVVVRRVLRTTVERDTVVDGRPAFVIATHADVHITSSGPMGNQPYTFRLTLDGFERGTSIVSAKGVLLSRTRTAEVRGANTYDGDGVNPIIVPQTYSYRSTLRALNPPRSE